MDANTTATHRMAHKGLLKVGIYILFLMALLFISSGRWDDWLMAWVYISVVVTITLVSVKFMTPELIAERSQPSNHANVGQTTCHADG